MIGVGVVTPDQFDVQWVTDVHAVNFRDGRETRAWAYLTDDDARTLHAALGKSIAAAEKETAAEELPAVAVQP